MIDGLVVVDKPAGWTSHDVVGRLRRVYGQRRIGHAGTLDPDATGVLLVGLGRVTRLLRYLQDTTKEYRGIVAFGVTTTTLDAAGEETARTPMPVLTRDDVVIATKTFLGEIDQVPPMVSAIKVDGRKLYDIARSGGDVERAARRVRIDRFDVVGFDAGDFPRAAVIVECSSGTYIRSLADDLGRAVGGCAHLASLRRTRVGSFALDEARGLEAIEADPLACVLTPAQAMRDLDAVTVDDDRARAVAHGAVLPRRDLAVDDGEGPVAVLDGTGVLLAVYDCGRVSAKPAVVLSGS